MAAPQASDPPPPAPPLKKRTRSRELALQFLYQVDLLGPEKVNDLTSFLQEQAEGGDAETTRYARLLVEGTLDATPELDAEIRSARLLTLHAAWRIDSVGAKAARDEISAIKFSVAGTMLRTVDTAIQVHGALGVTDDTILAYWYRHERAARIYDGADEVHQMRIAQRSIAAWTDTGSTARATGDLPI